METITQDEDHQLTRRIYGVPTPYRGDEAVPKDYCDANAGTGGSNGILDGGHADTDYTGGPIIDCGHVV